MNGKRHVLQLFSLLLVLCSAHRVLAAPAPRQLPPATQARLRAILNAPALQDAHVGVSIVALGTASTPHEFPSRSYDDKTQPVLFAQDAEKRFMPASNMKLFTAALALHELGPEHVFSTIVAENAIMNGEVRSDLYLIGGGDPSLTTAGINELAEVLHARGLRSVRGEIFGDGTLFQAETFGGRYPDGWTMDDAIWYYGPEINALALNRNQVDVTITGAQPGQPATLKIAPECPQFSVENRVLTAAPNEKTAPLRFDRSGTGGAITNHLTINGRIAPGKSVTEGVAVPAPSLWAAVLLRQALEQRGITVTGGAREATQAAKIRRRELARHDSPPLRVLLQRFLKKSDNLYAEMLLRAAVAPVPPGENAARRAHDRLRAWLQANGIATEGLRFEDGSGLSRYNLLTPRSLTQLLAAIEKLRGGEFLYDALPIAGRDGTLGKRMRSTPAENNVRAKTGSFSIAGNLSGYVTTRDGHRLAVSVLTNFARDTDDARRMQDELFAALADAAW